MHSICVSFIKYLLGNFYVQYAVLGPVLDKKINQISTLPAGSV